MNYGAEVPVRSAENTIKELSVLENIKTEKVIVEHEIRKGYKITLSRDTSNNEYILQYRIIDDEIGAKCGYPTSMEVGGFSISFPENALEAMVNILRTELETNAEW